MGTDPEIPHSFFLLLLSMYTFIYIKAQFHSYFTPTPYFQVLPFPSEQLQKVMVEIFPDEVGQLFRTLIYH